MLSLVHFYFEVTKNFRNFQKKMKIFLRGSSSRSLTDKQSEEDKRPKYNIPRTTEVRSCEWPCDNFLRAAGIYDDFYELAENAGLTAFLHDQREQYILLTNIFVQNFHFHARSSPPTVEFYLYDEHKEMTLYEFCEVCKLPYEGSVSEPRPRDVENFIVETTMGEERGVSEVRVASLHFPVLRYYSLLLGDV